MPNDPGRKIKKDQLAITVEKRDISRGIADSSSKTKKIHQATQMEDHEGQGCQELYLLGNEHQSEPSINLQVGHQEEDFEFLVDTGAE